jgi:hypothetical protein
VVATGGNRAQDELPQKPQKQAKTVAVGCDRLPLRAHGKEEVDGSSLSEGSTRLPARAEGHPLSGETSEDAVLQGIQADDGTRTHGLLHGNGALKFRPFAPVPPIRRRSDTEFRRAASASATSRASSASRRGSRSPAISALIISPVVVDGTVYAVRPHGLYALRVPHSLSLPPPAKPNAGALKPKPQ